MTKYLRALMAPVLLLAASGCSDAEPPSAPAGLVSASTATSTAKESWLAKYRNGAPSITIGFAAKTIGPAGGTIRLLDFEVVVPPNAVSKDTRFTIRLPVDPKAAEYALAEFGPHGQKFAVPVTLKLPLRGTTSDSTSVAPRVLWWDGAVWVPMPTTKTDDGRIQAPTDHFSEYGTEDTSTQRGFIIAGG